MVSLNPFEGASNRTAVMVIEKGRPTKYPVPYTLWRKVKGSRFTYESTLDDVTAATKRLNFYAEPVNKEDVTSAWLTARPKAVKAIRKILGKSDYEAHEGVNSGGANAVYWVEIVHKRPDGLVIVRNITEGAKVKVEEVTEPVEPDLLYPLLRGRDVQRWRAEPSGLLILPHTLETTWKSIPESQMQKKFPKTYAYLSRFKGVLLRRRSGWYQKAKDRLPFYTMFAIGDYTFAPWKVVWREQADSLTSSCVGLFDHKVVVPDHKLMLLGCQSETEAHYLCSLLNQGIVRAAVSGYTIEIQMGPHILQNVRIPRFDPKDKVHLRLSDLSMQAHNAAKSEDSKALRQIEAEIDRLGAKLWGLTDEELSEIQKSLRELSGEQEGTSMENEGQIPKGTFG